MVSGEVRDKAYSGVNLRLISDGMLAAVVMYVITLGVVYEIAVEPIFAYRFGVTYLSQRLYFSLG